ncbi:hypothetical protein [Heyndrickxia faecalis]|uniref:hypothetical protein n=1 Tax=Heyndrickxia faecalis TaxID=2824910 RepID=UPI003D243EB9
MRWPYEKIGVTTTRAFRNLLNKIHGDIADDMQEHKDRADNIQAQVDNLVADGDSSPEAAQARVGVDGTNYTTLKQRLDTEHADVTAQLAEKVKKDDYLSFKTLPYNPIPPKQGIKTNTPKIIKKTNTNQLVLVQRANKGYLVYNLQSGDGDTSSTSVGTTWDLLRLRKVEYSPLSYVWWDKAPTAGTLSTYLEGGINSGQEQGYFGARLTTNSGISDDGTGNGFSVKSLAPGKSVTFDIEASYESLMNMLFLGSSGSSSSVDILVNGSVIKNINPQLYRLPTQGNYAVVDFDVPRANFVDQKTISIQVRNNDGSNPFYFCCFNFFELKHYKGGTVNKFKSFLSGKLFMDSNGASDYAIFDHDLQKWCGSFHGGETSEYLRVMWKNLIDGLEETETMVNFSDVAANSWYIANQFRIWQKTNINNKAKMTSIFDFNTDGSVEMKFGLSNCSIVMENFYTALTCTHTGFQHISYPDIVQLTSNVDNYFDYAMGEITQYNAADSLDLNIRYTTFPRYLGDSRINPYITLNSSYAKFYYGVIAGSVNAPFNIKNLTFAKGLDFSIRK